MPGALSAIVGLGRSDVSRSPIGAASTLAATAVRRAVADSQLPIAAIDGLLLNQSALAPAGTLPLSLIDDIGLTDLRLLTALEGKGSSALQMLQYATMAIRQGVATKVACVFADTPVGPAKGAGQSFVSSAPFTGIAGWEAQYGLFGPAGAYALLARRYMHAFGVGEHLLGEYALACRRWARLNPAALQKDALTIEAYLASDYVAAPFRVLDCAYPVNGSVAIIVTSADAARNGPRPPVYVHGMGQGHRAVPRVASRNYEFETAGAMAAARAFAMAAVSAQDITACQFYDAFSYCVIAALEDYGLCRRGEAAQFIASGATSPGGSLPVNTGGGHLAAGYLQGMTPLEEGIAQGRGQAGERQVRHNDVILVNGSGGTLEYHAAAVLSPHASLQ